MREKHGETNFLFCRNIFFLVIIVGKETKVIQSCCFRRISTVRRTYNIKSILKHYIKYPNYIQLNSQNSLDIKNFSLYCNVLECIFFRFGPFWQNKTADFSKNNCALLDFYQTKVHSGGSCIRRNHYLRSSGRGKKVSNCQNGPKWKKIQMA